MTITNPETDTRIDEVTDRIYRISTPVKKLSGGFSFNQYLIDDDEPLLFHTGPTLLARMHGSAWRGNGGEMLMALAQALEG
jgi:hypothetical protein